MSGVSPLAARGGARCQPADGPDGAPGGPGENRRVRPLPSPTTARIGLGALIGTLVGLGLGIGANVSGTVLAFYGLLLGAALGALVVAGRGRDGDAR